MGHTLKEGFEESYFKIQRNSTLICNLLPEENKKQYMLQL